jgi:uncharacterized protein
MTEFGLPDSALSLIRVVLSSCPQVQRAVIYGSCAMGRHRPGSDIDLTLIGPDITPDMLDQLASRFEDSDLPYQVDLSRHQDIDSPGLLAHIERVGQVLYCRDASAQVI